MEKPDSTDGICREDDTCGDVDATCLFVSDLHGNIERYEKLLTCMAGPNRPSAVFIGGDIFPNAIGSNFLRDYFLPQFSALKQRMGSSYPNIFLILGNDDPRCYEPELTDAEQEGIWNYIHGQKRVLGRATIYGYSCVPPTPFRLRIGNATTFLDTVTQDAHPPKKAFEQFQSLREKSSGEL